MGAEENLIRINSLRLEIGYTEADIKAGVIKKLRLNNAELKGLKKIDPVKISLDARKKNDIHYTCSIDLEFDDEAALMKRIGADRRVKGRDISQTEKIRYNDPFDDVLSEQIKHLSEEERPVIVGLGPAGMICAYKLALAGLRPIVIERGQPVDQRIEDVNSFWKTGKLNPESNVQFGEGGAGTFSDGKLNTMIHDNSGRIGEVFDIFVRSGADPSIRYINKPHIGTDRLVGIVKSIRDSIIEHGGEVRFGCKLTGIEITNGAVSAISVEQNGEKTRMTCSRLVLAIGHSARDTFRMLYENGISMEKKAFAVGVRVEHPQELIGRAQYGDQYLKLPPADYKLTCKTADGRGVYSFCMCPGGFVVNASSEEGMMAVNGMSNSDRSEATANSALVVTVREDDIGGASPLAGVDFQRELEKKCFDEGRGRIPVQRLDDFMNDRKADELAAKPNTKGACVSGNLRAVLPGFITDSLIEAMPSFGRTIRGYDNPDTLLIGLESRTSSPVRITREEGSLQAVGVKGLYPCGEGAGYAGGITSAAVDGLRIYESIIKDCICLN